MTFKNTLIFGDSYSTFEGFIPEGYDVYYTAAPRPDTDVCRVEQTWWHRLMQETGSNLVLNNSWSGSTICYTGYDNVDCSATSSFIFRLQQLADAGFFEAHEINTVFIFGGTNDSWADVELGELMLHDVPAAQRYKVLPGIGHFLGEVRRHLPEAAVYCLINTELKPEIAAAMKEASLHFGIQPIEFNKVDKTSGHPTVQGMCDIKDQILAATK